MKNYHITKNDTNWQLKGEGADKATLTGRTKEEVIQKTREFMENKVGSVKIHKEDGKFQEERTYQRADDPRSSKG